MHNRPTQLARRWGAGPHPSESGDKGLQSVAICTLILSAQESAPLLAEGNTCPYFPKNNEQDCFNRTYLGTTFLSYFRITLGGRQKISSCLWFCLLFSSQHNSSGLTEETGLTCVLTGHLFIFSYVHWLQYLPGQFKVLCKNPTCVYYLGAALGGHLWEVRGTEDTGGKQAEHRREGNEPGPSSQGCGSATCLKSTWQRTEVATPTKGTWCQHLKQAGTKYAQEMFQNTKE